MLWWIVILGGLVLIRFLVLTFRRYRGLAIFWGIGRMIFLSFIWIIILFYWFWGFHYGRQSMQEYLRIDLKNIKIGRLVSEADQVLQRLVALREELQVGDTLSLAMSNIEATQDAAILEAAKALFINLDLPIYGKRLVKDFVPSGFLLRLGTLGFYNPWTGECYVEKDLHPLQKVFVKAHEWTHAQGITDEGDANFLAFLICYYAEDPYLRYAGHLEYFRYILADIRKSDRSLYLEIKENLPKGISIDISEIKESLQKYPEWMPAIRDVLYDSYLKANGVTEGLDSYHRIVRMVIAYHQTKVL